jgi:hypothetical protein
MLALLLAVGGVVAAQWLGGWRGVLLAAGLCGLALWTKQTTVTATLAVALSLTLRSWRRGAVFACLVGIPSLAAVLLLNLATQGQFGRHVLSGNASNPVEPVRSVVFVGTLLVLYLPAVAAGLWWLRRALTGAPSPVTLYLPIALLAAFSAGNGGSSVNYLIEPVVALALIAPFAWRGVPAAAALAAPLFAAMQLAVLVHWPNSFGTTYLAESALGRTPTAIDAAVGARLDELVRAEPGELIAEPAGFAVRNGRPVYLQPIDLRAEQLQGRWRPEPLVAALSSGRFTTILGAYNLFPLDAQHAIESRFSVAETLTSPDGLTFTVYRFRP